jgi:hypothetical protein
MRHSNNVNNISNLQKIRHRSQVPKEELNLSDEEKEDY